MSVYEKILKKLKKRDPTIDEYYKENKKTKSRKRKQIEKANNKQE